MTLLNFVLTLYMIYIRPGSAVSWAQIWALKNIFEKVLDIRFRM